MSRGLKLSKLSATTLQIPLQTSNGTDMTGLSRVYGGGASRSIKKLISATAIQQNEKTGGGTQTCNGKLRHLIVKNSGTILAKQDMNSLSNTNTTSANL